MYTYQDWLSAVSKGETKDFILSAVSSHRNSGAYRTAVLADRYYHLENPTIMRYQKMIETMAGRAVPDRWSPNNKIPSNWYFYFVTQAIGHLLSNGVYFEQDSTKKRLDRKFDRRIVELATHAKNDGVSFGFYNHDHIDVFTLREFVPFYDEYDGSLKAGIRFWQIDSGKPERFVVYEPDGITEYLKEPNEEMQVTVPKHTYRRIVSVSEAGGAVITDGENYPGFPIVPFYNILKQSEIVGNVNVIDAYDLMASGLVNNTDEGNFIYWILKNCDGMNEADDERFIADLKRHHFAHANGDDGAGVESHTVETPFEAHQAALDRLERQLFANFMAADVRKISAGNVTATEILAAYEPLNAKTDLFEYQVIDFIEGIMKIAGIEDNPTFKRSQIVNQLEETEMVLSAAEWLDEETVLRKLPWVTVDEVEEILARRAEADMARMQNKAEEDVPVDDPAAEDEEELE